MVTTFERNTWADIQWGFVLNLSTLPSTQGCHISALCSVVGLYFYIVAEKYCLKTQHHSHEYRLLVDIYGLKTDQHSSKL